MEIAAASALSFIVTIVATYVHIHLFKKWGVVGIDRHKLSRPRIPEMGGIAIFLGIACGYLAIFALLQKSYALVALTSLSIVFFIGIVDDRFVLRQRTKLLLLMFSALPLFYIKDGSLDLAVFEIRYGALYVAAVLIGMTAASNLTNILEGFNGEAIGLGVISTAFLAADGFIINSTPLVTLSAPLCLALLAFLYFNKYPAKVFPGDTGTLLIGGAIGAASIISGHVTFGIIVLFPQIFEFFLKFRVRFAGVKLGPTKVDEAGYLTPPPYNSLANLLTGHFHLKEPQLVFTIWCIGALFGIVSMIVAFVM